MDDLTNNPQPPEVSGVSPPPLSYEETPIINAATGQPAPQPPITETSFVPQIPVAPAKPKRGFLGTLVFIIILVILFAAGIWLSIFLRTYLPGLLTPTPSASVSPAPTPTPSLSLSPADPFAAWKEYGVLNAITRKPLEGVSFKLPPEILGPLCDGASCASQGTYLPGGTRFTVAPRGQGQYLADFRGKIITDVAGKQFIAKDTVVAGHPAIEFTGDFSGTTIGGYVFSKMHGYMIAVTPTLSLEINHFTPSLVTADFLKDDILLGRILETVVLPAWTVTPTLSPTPVTKGGVPTATSSAQ